MAEYLSYIKNRFHLIWHAIFHTLCNYKFNIHSLESWKVVRLWLSQNIKKSEQPCTVGSSLNTSSPTVALAMAFLMSSVGLVNTSLLMSMTYRSSWCDVLIVLLIWHLCKHRLECGRCFCSWMVDLTPGRSVLINLCMALVSEIIDRSIFFEKHKDTVV